jgi:hypothetical protein
VAVRVGQQDVIWFENLGGDVSHMFLTSPHRIVAVTSSASSVMFVDLAVLRPDPTGVFNDLNVVASVQSANIVSYFTPRSKVVFVSTGECGHLLGWEGGRGSVHARANVRVDRKSPGGGVVHGFHDLPHTRAYLHPPPPFSQQTRTPPPATPPPSCPTAPAWRRPWCPCHRARTSPRCLSAAGWASTTWFSAHLCCR